MRDVLVVPALGRVVRVLLCGALLAEATVVCTPARAAVIHEFLPAPSHTLSEGVPASSGEPITGPLSGVNSLATDSGHLWVAEKLEGTTQSRVDEFDDATGAFIAPQLTPSGAQSELDQPMAVGHPAGHEQLFLAALEETRGVVLTFNEKREELAVWTGAKTVNGSFTESGGEPVAGISGVAVDSDSNSLEDWASGDVLVATDRRAIYEGTSEFEVFNTVNVFAPLVSGAEPSPVTQITGTCAAPGTCPGAAIPFASPGAVAVSGFNGDVLVVDGGKVLDVFEPVGIDEYAFVRQLTGTSTETFAGLGAIAVDGGNGDIYAVDGSRVDEFDAEGNFLATITGTTAGPFTELGGLSVDASSHDLFVGDRLQEPSVGQLDVFGPDLVVPDVATEAASDVTTTSAQLNGTVDAVGAGAASCEFEWGTTRALGHTLPCSSTVPEGSTPEAVHATLTGLQSGNTYFFRLVARNSNGLNPGEEAQDQELRVAGPGMHGESASAVSADAATLEGRIDPHGESTNYYFEYWRSEDPAHISFAPNAQGDSIGSGAGDVAVQQRIHGLTAGESYSYRLVAVSEVSPGNDESFRESEKSFLTRIVGSGFSLPDGRGWEMVSPPDKHGAQIAGIGESHTTESSREGTAMTFEATAPTEGQPAGFANFVQVLATRGSVGWSTQDIPGAHESATGEGGVDYRIFSEDLFHAVLQPVGAFTRSLSDEASEQTAYLRTSFIEEDPAKLCEEGCFHPLVVGCSLEKSCAAPVSEHANVPVGTEFGEEGLCPGPTKKEKCGPQVVGATPDLKHLVLKSSAALTPGANAGGALYEWSGGALSPVSMLNGEVPDTNTPLLGLEDKSARNAISEDGSRVVWSELGGHLYVRDTVRKETVQLDTASDGSGAGPIDPRFQIASNDGSRVFFTDDQELTSNAGAEGNLYECQMIVVGGELTCSLTDLTPVGSGGEPPAVRDYVLGASEDGSWVYFVADGVLAPGATRGSCGEFGGGSPETVSCNLYAWHNGTTRLVARLSVGDYPDWNGHASPAALTQLTARVSPDGRWLTFMSQRELTGYDSHDAVTGGPDEEVFLYDSAGAGKVICASCNPTGARPVGIEFGKMGAETLGTGVWPDSQGLGGSVPIWETYSIAHEARYQPRYLSDNGRLFFNSNDPLVPEDVNGTGDVYEFEPTDVGSCAGGSSGTVAYVPASEGCVGLISAGSGSEESDFLDASASGGRDAEGAEGGGDVFFLTADRLSSQDFDESSDVYDAHECTPADPCSPAVISTHRSCTGEEECKGAPTPPPPPPTSATGAFSGSGNLLASSPSPRPKALTPAQQLAHEITACKRKKGKTRTSCERAAHRKYERAMLARAVKACKSKQGHRARAACEGAAKRRYTAQTQTRRGSR